MTSITEGQILACLLGGAVGDALGAPVEFMSLAQIRAAFGERGITHFAPAYSRLGAITDDTQMTLFTAEGLLRAAMRGYVRGICAHETVVWHAYQRWLITQGESAPGVNKDLVESGWLWQQKMLHCRRGPGNTCLSALAGGQLGTVESPINNSKGCGGIMRAAPAGLLPNFPISQFDLGCDTAALTHGHPSGYLAAGFLAHVIAQIVEMPGLERAIESARSELIRRRGHEECLKAVDDAVTLAETADATPENVQALGEGWVAEEALAISLFCALKAESFEHGVRLAVNHGGDSDSTGAITGNILGVLLGKQAIQQEFLDDLEPRDLIEELAADMLACSQGPEHWTDDKYGEKYPPN